METSNLNKIEKSGYCNVCGSSMIVNCQVCNDGLVDCNSCHNGRTQCTHCSGTGHDEKRILLLFKKKCCACFGSGQIECDTCKGESSIKCDNCKGSGRVCFHCLMKESGLHSIVEEIKSSLKNHIREKVENEIGEELPKLTKMELVKIDFEKLAGDILQTAVIRISNEYIEQMIEQMAKNVSENLTRTGIDSNWKSALFDLIKDNLESEVESVKSEILNLIERNCIEDYLLKIPEMIEEIQRAVENEVLIGEFQMIVQSASNEATKCNNFKSILAETLRLVCEEAPDYVDNELFNMLEVGFTAEYLHEVRKKYQILSKKQLRIEDREQFQRKFRDDFMIEFTEKFPLELCEENVLEEWTTVDAESLEDQISDSQKVALANNIILILSVILIRITKIPVDEIHEMFVKQIQLSLNAAKLRESSTRGHEVSDKAMLTSPSRRF